MIKPKGQDIAAAIIDWYKEDIKGGSKDLYDLGKFLFTASSGSIGVFSALAKLNDHFMPGLAFFSSLAIYGISAIIAVDLLRPKLRIISGSTDIASVYQVAVMDGIHRFYQWMILWFSATIVGVYSLFIM